MIFFQTVGYVDVSELNLAMFGTLGSNIDGQKENKFIDLIEGYSFYFYSFYFLEWK